MVDQDLDPVRLPTIVPPYELRRHYEGADLVIEMSDGTQVIHGGAPIRRNIGRVLAVTDEYGCRTEFEH